MMVVDKEYFRRYNREHAESIRKSRRKYEASKRGKLVRERFKPRKKKLDDINWRRWSAVNREKIYLKDMRGRVKLAFELDKMGVLEKINRKAGDTLKVIDDAEGLTPIEQKGVHEIVPLLEAIKKLSSIYISKLRKYKKNAEL